MARTGRPSKYEPAFAAKARKLCELGATEMDVAEVLGVDRATVGRWAQRYPEFRAALRVGRDAADERVERSLYNRATGYTYEAEKIFQYGGNIVRGTYTEHVPPDVTAMIYWLKNRKPAEWRDRVEARLEGSIEVEDITARRLALAVVALLRQAGPVIEGTAERIGDG